MNFSRNAERRFTFQLGVTPEADLAHAQTLAMNTLEGLPFVLDTPHASVWIESVDDSWVTMGMAAWINQNDTSIVLARSEAIRLVQATFDTAGIGAQAPAYRLINDGAAIGDSASTLQEQHFEGPDVPPTPPQDVDALEDKQLEQIVDMERAEEHSDLLRENADQE